MGYFSLDIKKAKGSSDTVQSDHIERRIIPKNASEQGTYRIPRWRSWQG